MHKSEIRGQDLAVDFEPLLQNPTNLFRDKYAEFSVFLRFFDPPRHPRCHTVGLGVHKCVQFARKLCTHCAQCLATLACRGIPRPAGLDGSPSYASHPTCGAPSPHAKHAYSSTVRVARTGRSLSILLFYINIINTLISHSRRFHSSSQGVRGPCTRVSRNTRTLLAITFS